IYNSVASRLHTLNLTFLRQVPEVTSVNNKAGRPENDTEPKKINMAEFLVKLDPASRRLRGLTKEQLIDQMEQALVAIPGIKPSFSQPIRDNVLESISQIDGQIVIKVFGEDTGILRDKAQEVLNTVSSVRG